jgi:pimeloyl-ACP methyl ester carboxylesterase
MATAEEPLATGEEPLVTTEEPMETDKKSLPADEEPLPTDEEPLETDEEPLAADEEIAEPKKAIYILPGFTASRLYNSSGNEVWLNLRTAQDIASFYLKGRSEMMNNDSGSGATVFADRNRDRAGTLGGIYSTMINSIKADLAENQLSDTYTVEFFSYNWLVDINQIARELAADIEAKEYDSVILIGHSNGVVLANAFVGLNPENKNKIEKAIMIGGPFMGTYLGLDILETGALRLYDGTLLTGIIEVGYDAIVKPLTKKWMKSIMNNTPNVYQLLPGGEYVSRTPILYNTDSGTRSISDPEEYYALLAKSPNLNPILVSGNERSLKYLHETVYQNDVLGLWEGTDLTIIGNEYGRLTPYTAVYNQSGDKVTYGGLLYNKMGDAMVVDFSANGDGRFQYINFPGVHHILFLADSKTLTCINDIILDRPVSYNVPFSSHNTPAPSAQPSDGMSDMIRVELKSSDPLAPNLLNKGISVIIYDAKGKIVAFACGERQAGFEKNNFVYSSWETSENATNILCYIPKNGYRMEVHTGNIFRATSNITVFTETLDSSGAILARNEYKLTGANWLTGSVFTLDAGKSMTPAAKSGVKQTTLSIEKYKQDWQFTSDTLTMKRNTTTTPTVIGPDASHMLINDYIWSSSDPSVADVSSSGLITAKSPGTATITAVAPDDSYKIASIDVTVTR